MILETSFAYVGCSLAGSAAIESAGIMAIAENTLITSVFFVLLSNKKCQLGKNEYCYDAIVRRLI
jgi:hypothetical protein